MAGTMTRLQWDMEAREKNEERREGKREENEERRDEERKREVMREKKENHRKVEGKKGWRMERSWRIRDKDRGRVEKRRQKREQIKS